MPGCNLIHIPLPQRATLPILHAIANWIISFPLECFQNNFRMSFRIKSGHTAPSKSGTCPPLQLLSHIWCVCTRHAVLLLPEMCFLPPHLSCSFIFYEKLTWTQPSKKSSLSPSQEFWAPALCSLLHTILTQQLSHFNMPNNECVCPLYAISYLRAAGLHYLMVTILSSNKFTLILHP